MRNYIVFFAIICLLAPAILALGINVQDNIPSGTTFTATINYSLSDNQQVNIYLDDLLLAEVFNHSSNIFINESGLSPQVLAINATETKTVLSIAGQNESTKSLKAKLIDNDKTIETKSTSIVFFRAISIEEKTAMDAQITLLQKKVIDQNKIIFDQNNTITSLQVDLNAKQKTINILVEENKVTDNALKDLSSEIIILQNSDKNKSEALQRIGGDINNLFVQRETDSALAGLFAFGTNSSIIGFSLLFVLAVIALIGFIIKKKRSEKFYQ